MAEQGDIAHQRKDYPYFTDDEFHSNFGENKAILDRIHVRARERYEKRIANYSLYSNNVNIVVTGRTGAGKSLLINAIHGRPVSKVASSSESVTKSSSYATSKYDKRTITIVDTPGIHDTSKDEKALQKELTRIAFLLREGVHCLIICMSASDPRFTEESARMLNQILFVDKNDFSHYSMLVYTKADAELNKQTLNDFLEKQKEQKLLNAFLQKIGHRILAVNSATEIPAEMERNRKDLIAMVDKVIEANILNNRPEFITNDLFKQANALYIKVASVVDKKRCHPSVINAVIETIINKYSFSNFRETDFISNVLSILQKSETFEMTNNSFIFKNDVNTVTIPRDIVIEHIKLIHNEIKTEIKQFYMKVAGMVGGGVLALSQCVIA